MEINTNKVRVILSQQEVMELVKENKLYDLVESIATLDLSLGIVGDYASVDGNLLNGIKEKVETTKVDEDKIASLYQSVFKDI